MSPQLLLLLLPAPGAHAAADAFQGMVVSATYARVTVTHYSATPRGGRSCSYEHGAGGPDESPSGLRPQSYRIDKPGLFHGRPTILTAVPQRGGTAGLYGCFFALPDAYPGKLFYAGDRYGPDSNGKNKTDVSSPCTSIVNTTLTSKLVAYNCPGKRGGLAPPPLREPGSTEPPPSEEPPAPPAPAPSPAPSQRPPEPAPEPAGACGWYAILSCDRSEAASRHDLVRFGGEARLLRSDDFANFRPGWWCVALPASSGADAQRKASSSRGRAPGAYAKKGC